MSIITFHIQPMLDEKNSGRPCGGFFVADGGDLPRILSVQD
jgi:hypothetical protein